MQDDLTEGLVGADGGPVPATAGLAADRSQVSASLAEAAPVDVPPPAPDAPAGPAVDAELEALQAWFAHVMTHPGRFEAALEAGRDAQRALGARALEQLLRPSDRQSAAERLAIYHRAYHGRLVGCVQEDFRAVGHALGPDRFRSICLAYVRAHPSTSANLNVYSEGFVRFLASDAEVGELDRAALVAVAELEWALVEALHAPAGGAFDLDALRAVPPEGWAELVLAPSPGLFFVVSEYPTNAYYQAWVRGERPPLPAPERSATAVYRREGRLWRMGFTPAMSAVLQAILQGAPLGEALAILERPEHDAGEADVMRWFSGWVEAGFFVGLG